MSAEVVAVFLRESFGLLEEDLSSDVPLAIYIDSLGLIQLIIFLETSFGISIDSSMVSPEALSTPASLMEWVATLAATAETP